MTALPKATSGQRPAAALAVTSKLTSTFDFSGGTSIMFTSAPGGWQGNMSMTGCDQPASRCTFTRSFALPPCGTLSARLMVTLKGRCGCLP